MAKYTRHPSYYGIHLPFRVCLALATAFLVVLTSTLILLDVYTESRKAAEKDAEDTYVQVAANVGDQLDYLFRETGGWATFGAAQRSMLEPIDASS